MELIYLTNLKILKEKTHNLHQLIIATMSFPKNMNEVQMENFLYGEENSIKRNQRHLISYGPLKNKNDSKNY